MKSMLSLTGTLVALLLLTGAPAVAQAGSAGDDPSQEGWSWDWGLEAKAHYRDSDLNRFPISFPFSPQMLPVGQDSGFLETVEEGQHFEVSVVRLALDAALDAVGADLPGSVLHPMSIDGLARAGKVLVVRGQAGSNRRPGGEAPRRWAAP